MKTKVFLFIILTSCLLFFVSCGIEDLSRSKAEELIIKKYKLPRPVAKELRLWNLAFNMRTAEGIKQKKFYSQMASDGLVSMDYPKHTIDTQNIDLASTEIYKILLTEKGKEFQVNVEMTGKPDPGGKLFLELTRNQIILLKVYEQKFGKVTGIKKLDSNTREVHFTFENVNFTPFHPYLCLTDIPKEENAVDRFILYDDGWRLE